MLTNVGVRYLQCIYPALCPIVHSWTLVDIFLLSNMVYSTVCVRCSFGTKSGVNQETFREEMAKLFRISQHVHKLLLL